MKTLFLVTFLVPTLAAAQSAAPAMRIGVVNQDRILNESEEGKRLKGELDQLRTAKATSIEVKEKEIKAIQDQLLNAQLSLSQDKRDDIARQLKRKRVEYERLNDDATADFQEAANRAQKRLLALFRDVIEDYGTEKGYTIILEKNTLYFAANPVDITDDLMTRFNEMSSTSGSS